MKKIKPKLRAWTVISEAVETGVGFGLRRAMKYGSAEIAEDRVDTVADYIEHEVLNALSDVMDFGDR